MTVPYTDYIKLVRLETNIGDRLRDGHVDIGDLVDWWTRILGRDLADVGWKVVK